MKQAPQAGLRAWHLDTIGLGICCGLTALGYLFTIKPLAAERTQRTSMKADLSSLQQQARQDKTTQESLANELTRIRDEVEGSPVQLQPARNVNGKIALIVDVAHESGMQIHESQAGDVVSGTSYQTVPIQFSGRGSYSSCARFMHRLYHDLPDVEVLSFGIAGTPAPTGSASTFQFDLAWYAAPELVATP